MSPARPTPYLRASDADREEAVERLRRATVEGRLDSDELEERLAAAYRARWTAELEPLTADVTPPPSPARWAPVRYPPATRTNGLAAVSLIASLMWVWFLGSVVGVIAGHVALRQIARSGGRQSGRGMAIAGIVIGYIGIAGLLLRIALFAG